MDFQYPDDHILWDALDTSAFDSSNASALPCPTALPSCIESSSLTMGYAMSTNDITFENETSDDALFSDSPQYLDRCNSKRSYPDSLEPAARKRACTSAKCAPEGIKPTAIPVCESWLTNYPTVFPKPKHIRALADLTEVPAQNIERWLARRMRQGNEATKFDDLGTAASMISFSSAEPSTSSYTWSPAGSDCAPGTMQGLAAVETSQELEHSGYQQAFDEPNSHERTLSLPSVQGGLRKDMLASAARKGRDRGDKLNRACKPAASKSLLAFDPRKPYQCTRLCGKSFSKKDDWRKHEELRFPQEGWVCLAPAYGSEQHSERESSPSGSCESAAESENRCDDASRHGVCGKQFYRRQHLKQHFSLVHSDIVDKAEYEELGYFRIDSDFDPVCGFCGERLETWKKRISHVARHFQEGEEMKQWGIPR